MSFAISDDRGIVVATTVSDVLRASGIRKEFGSVAALAGVDLFLKAGEIVGLLGPNGAGKTTLVKVLSGLLLPSSGSVSLFGKPLTPAAVRSHVGLVLEGKPSLVEFMTGRENLLYFGYLLGIPGRVLVERASEALEAVGLTADAGKPVQFYSWGMKRRLAMAVSLLKGARVMLLDEPHVSLDLESVTALRQLLLRLKGEGRAVLLTGHDLNFMEALCDRIIVLKKGRVVAEGTLSSLVESLGLQKSVRVTLRQVKPEDFPEGLALEVLQQSGDLLSLRILLKDLKTLLSGFQGQVVDVASDEPVLASVFREVLRS